MFISRKESLGQREGHRRLSDPACSDDTDEPVPRQLIPKYADRIGAAKCARLRDRQIVGAYPLRGRALWHQVLFWLGEVDRCHEAIAAPRNIGKVSTTWLAVAQRPSKRRDMDLEVALLDDRVGPHARHELVLGNQLARALDQCCQDLQGTAAETNGGVTFQQKLLRRKEAEGTERNRTIGRGGGLLGQFDLALRHLTSINLTDVRSGKEPCL